MNKSRQGRFPERSANLEFHRNWERRGIEPAHTICLIKTVLLLRMVSSYSTLRNREIRYEKLVQILPSHIMSACLHPRQDVLSFPLRFRLTIPTLVCQLASHIRLADRVRMNIITISVRLSLGRNSLTWVAQHLTCIASHLRRGIVRDWTRTSRASLSFAIGG